MDISSCAFVKIKKNMPNSEPQISRLNQARSQTILMKNINNPYMILTYALSFIGKAYIRHI
jgi:hypothetical protein